MRQARQERAAGQLARRVAVRIRTRREHLGISRAILAQQVGLTIGALGHIERGTGLPSFPTLLSLCATLELTPNDLLLERTGHVPLAPKATAEREWVACWARLGAGPRQSLLRLARELGQVRARPAQPRR